MTRPISIVLACLTACLALGATQATADPPQREIRNTFGVMVNVIGLEDILDVTWRRSLSRSPNPLLSDAHFTLGLTNTFSPAYDRIGAWVELSPLSILDLRAGIEPTLYFGLFNSLQDFESYESVFDETTRKETNDLSYMGFGGRVFLAPTFKMRLGSVVGAVSAEWEWWRAGGDGPYFYEPARDILLESKGDRLFRASSVLLLERRLSDGKKLLFGPMHQILDVEGARKNRVQRVGVLIVYELGERALGLTKPSLIGQAAYYLDDRFKRHEPWALVAIRFHIGG
jgi:hypothetical protein